jgi:hypothetical protein
VVLFFLLKIVMISNLYSNGNYGQYKTLGEPLYFGPLQLLYPKAQDGLELLPVGTKTNNQYDAKVYQPDFGYNRERIVCEPNPYRPEEVSFLQNREKEFLTSGDFPRNGRALQIQNQFRENNLPMYYDDFRILSPNAYTS